VWTACPRDLNVSHTRNSTKGKEWREEWGNVRNRKKVFKQQKRAITLIANISSTTSCKPYFKKLKIMTLPCMYIYEILLYIKMSLNKFKTNYMFHSHDTRTKSDLFITSHNTKLFEQSTAYNGVLVYIKTT
jgi:hypothetical protein